MADQASDLRLQECGELRFDPAERQGERLVPGHRPKTLEGADGRGRDGHCVPARARAGLAHQAAVAEGRAWKRVSPPGLDARTESRPVAERVGTWHRGGDRTRAGSREP